MDISEKKQIISHQRSVLDRRYRPQLLATITVQLLTFAYGISIGWTSPTLLKLQSNDSPTNSVFSVEHVSWMGSLFGLGSLAGNSFGLLLNRIGRKRCLYLIALPYITSWILVFFSKTHIYLYVARFLAGMTGGGVFVVIPIFVTDIADPSIRGTLTSMIMVFFSSGIMAGFVFGSHLDYFVNPFIIIIFPIVYLIGLLKFPETPQYLLRIQEIEKARDAFKFYRNLPKYENFKATAGERQELNVDVEFQQLKENILSSSSKMEKISLKDFVCCASLKAFFTAFILLALCQFSGTLAFLYYMSEIFARAGTNINPNTCTIIMGVAQIVATGLTMITVDRFGRKLLMLVSSFGMAVGLLGFGLYMQSTTSELKLEYNWFPLVVMTFIILMANLAVTGIIIVEIFPSKIRAPATTICTSVTSLMIFVALKTFPLILQNYGLVTLLYICGSVSVVGGLYLLVFLNETKGKSID